MKMIVIHSRTSRILHEGELFIIPGIGTRVYINPTPLRIEIEREVDEVLRKGGLKIRGYDDHGRLPKTEWIETDRDDIRDHVINFMKLDPEDFTTVLALEHCPKTGDTKVFVGSELELDKPQTQSQINPSSRRRSTSTPSKNDDGFLDGFLLAGLAMSSMD